MEKLAVFNGESHEARKLMGAWRVAFWKEWWGLMAVDGGEQGCSPLCLRQRWLLKAPFGDPGTWVMHVLETMIGSILIGESLSRKNYIP